MTIYHYIEKHTFVKNTNNLNCPGTCIDTSMVKTDNIATAVLQLII